MKNIISYRKSKRILIFLKTVKIIPCLIFLMLIFSFPMNAKSRPHIMDLKTKSGAYSGPSKTIFPVHPIEGKVTDSATGEPLVGVSIKVKGTKNGTVTESDGSFQLEVEKGAQLVISYLGYSTKTIKIDNQSTLDINLSTAAKGLDQVVVVGYGTQKKKNVTGAITSIDSKDIVLNPSSNPMTALQGKVPGLEITKSSGKAGADIAMQLRGTRSISASGNPLILIDGMPGSYKNLNPNDIKSIDILKDASSTAIYGAAGANGVILITTKNAEKGKTKVNFNTYIGFNGWSTTPKVHGGNEYFQIKKLAQQEAGTYTSDEEVLKPKVYEAYKRGETINWVDAIMSNKLTQNYSVSFSSGFNKTKVYFSLNYNDEKGQYKGDDYKVFSSNFRINQEITNWFETGVNGQMAYTNSNNTYSKMENALRATPYGRLYDDEGNLNVLPVAGDEQTVNYLLDTDKDVYRDENKGFDLYLNPYIRINPIRGLSLESRLGIHLSYPRSNSFVGIGSYQYYWNEGASATGTAPTVSAAITQNRTQSYRWENILTYKFNIDNVHHFKFTGVTTYNYNQHENTSMSNNQISSNAYLWHNIAIGNSPSVNSSYTMSKRLGIIGRLNYSYKDKYLFQASVRKDGSSKLAKGKKWETFPAISAGWRISEEPFMQNTQKWLSSLKIRLGYGVTGTASIDPYSSIANIEAGYYSLSGKKVNKDNFSQLLPNPDLTWEKSHNTNIGIDAGLLNNRINLTADYFITHTDGVIWTKNIPAVNGAYNASTPYQTRINIAKTQNRGVELALTTHNIVKNNFKWNSTITYTQTKGEITKLAKKSNSPVINEDYALLVGHSLQSYYDYKILGIWQKNEAEAAAVFGQKPGDIKIDVPHLIKEGKNRYSKVNSQGKPVVDDDGNKVIYDKQNPYAISDNDKQIIGHHSPDWWLGFQNTFNYKSFDLTIYAYMRYGQMINYSLLTDYDPTGGDNFPSYFNYWTSSNPSNDFPGLNASRKRQSYTGFSGLSYVNGSFIKLKNITLGYTLPHHFMKNIGIEKLRFYGTITNLFVVAKSHLLKDYDPEQDGSLDFPLTKQIVIGLNLTF